MAWDKTPGTRRDLPPDWHRLVQKCKAAAGGRCEWILPSGRRCPRDGEEADHYGQAWEHNKLRWLCSHHHKIHTQRQAQRARSKASGRPKPKKQRHPGALRRTGET